MPKKLEIWSPKLNMRVLENVNEGVHGRQFGDSCRAINVDNRL